MRLEPQSFRTVVPARPLLHKTYHSDRLSAKGTFAVIYFFVKDRQFVQCEIHPGPPHIFTIVQADGSVRNEAYAATEELQQHWGEVCRQLERDGWQGPFGRDSRA